VLLENLVSRFFVFLLEQMAFLEGQVCCRRIKIKVRFKSLQVLLLSILLLYNLEVDMIFYR